MYKITNIDDVVKYFYNEIDFINYAQEIFRENEAETEVEDIPKCPETINECVYYLETYCSNLTLIIQ